MGLTLPGALDRSEKGEEMKKKKAWWVKKGWKKAHRIHYWSVWFTDCEIHKLWSRKGLKVTKNPDKCKKCAAIERKEKK
jgi:hypothetical protein